MDHLLKLLRQAERLGEPGAGTDQLAHALQCAHELRTTAPDDVELQVAGLLHDIGHVLAHEVAAFAELPDCADAVLLRSADEAAKVPGRQVPGLETWTPVLRDLTG